MAPPIIPYVPQTITVHLGSPRSNAQNVTVRFADYIKNVASSEIYPTWNESAIYANIYAQISFALNRVYTEFYPAQGYDFEITNSTAIDQKFIYGRNIFSNIDRIVDNIFNDYIRRQGFAEPLAAKYCNGTTVTCEGLSQWGSEYLARQGYSSIDILYNYYGYDIELVQNAPVRGLTRSYPGYAIRRGDSGENVAVIQTAINRISTNYPSIPKMAVDGIFGEATENAVKQFQSIFNLTPDGIVGKATWYKMVGLYTGITRLSELDSEGQTIFGRSLQYPDSIGNSLSMGDSGSEVETLQFFLNVVSSVNPYVPPVEIDGIFGQQTFDSVVAFQKFTNLDPDGVVGDKTWHSLYEAFRGVIDTVYLSEDVLRITTSPYPGTALTQGSQGESVISLQQYLNAIASANPGLGTINVTGTFDAPTRQAVIRYQQAFDLMPTGTVDEATWNSITNSYKNVLSETLTQPTQFPGRTLRLGDSDFDDDGTNTDN